MQATHRLVIRFDAPVTAASAPDIGPYREELERFSAADPRWCNLIDMAAAVLSDPARCTLGVALSGLEVGLAPKLLSFDFAPDDAETMVREAAHMAPRLLSGLSVLTAAR